MNDYKPLLNNRPDYIVCTCMGVMYSEIMHAIENGADSFEKLADMFFIGTGCSSCVPEVMELLQEHKKGVR